MQGSFTKCFTSQNSQTLEQFFESLYVFTVTVFHNDKIFKFAFFSGIKSIESADTMEFPSLHHHLHPCQGCGQCSTLCLTLIQTAATWLCLGPCHFLRLWRVPSSMPRLLVFLCLVDPGTSICWQIIWGPSLCFSNPRSKAPLTVKHVHLCCSQLIKSS